MAKKVTTIPATRNLFDSKPLINSERRKVAGYARVSTDTDEQATSYDAQMEYYTKYISAHLDWVFVGMYSDDGITATNKNHREGFNKMIEDALAGKIDLIVTKSVSRFARNTVDSLTTVRQLKEKGIEVYFEKENIWTLDAKGELLITIMSSLAQEESRSISENTTWGKRRSFEEGKASVGFKWFLGYDRGPNGEFVVNEEQAKTVRYIYKRFLDGMSAYAVCKELMQMGIKAPGGGDRWHQSTVLSILQNEKYKGDALLQKGFTKDFLTHKRVPNNGEVPQYYVEGHHEAIVTPEQFELAQAEIARRNGYERYYAMNCFQGKLRCGECGAWYATKVWHSNSKYKKTVYQCGRKYGNNRKRGKPRVGTGCKSPHAYEDDIKRWFVMAVNKLYADKNEIIENTRTMMKLVCKTDDLEREMESCLAEMNIVAEQMKHAVGANSQTPLNQTEYERRYNELTDRYGRAKARYDELTDEIAARKGKKAIFESFIKDLKGRKGIVKEFDEDLWCTLVQEIVLTTKEDIRVVFKNGYEVNICE